MFQPERQEATAHEQGSISEMVGQAMLHDLMPKNAQTNEQESTSETVGRPYRPYPPYYPPYPHPGYPNGTGGNNTNENGGSWPPGGTADTGRVDPDMRNGQYQTPDGRWHF